MSCKKIRLPRCPNYSPEEVERLIYLVKDRVDIIECKKRDYFTRDAKLTAWKNLATEFNGCGNVHRSSKQLKSKYGVLKKSVKDKCARIRQELYKTGGGPQCPITLSVLEEIIRDMISVNIEGINCIYDPDYIEVLTTESPPIEEPVLDGELWGGMFCAANLRTPVNPVSRVNRGNECASTSNQEQEVIVIPVPSLDLGNTSQREEEVLTIPVTNVSSMSALQSPVPTTLGTMSRCSKRKRDTAADEMAEMAMKKKELAELEICMKKSKAEQNQQEHQVRMQDNQHRQDLETNEHLLRIQILEQEKEIKLKEHEIRLEKHRLEIKILEKELAKQV